MSWSAACLSVVLASSPASPQRFNGEPVGFGVAGLVVAGLGVWRLAVAENLYLELSRIPTSASSAQEAAASLSAARRLVTAGKLETAGGAVLIVLGAAVALSSALWLFLEGPSTRNWWVSVGPGGASMTATF
ncbi:MAG: hypothetical protein JNM69_39755 [Archangium sp.]|nr:hypothetical protein [Archangium sp.]